jgi:hypothetical protein
MNSNNQANQPPREESEKIAGVENDQTESSGEEPELQDAELRQVDLGVQRPATNPKMTVT